MPSDQPVSDREIWSRTLCFVLLGFICYALPWPSQANPAETTQTLMRIQGSNTIGAELGPALVEGLLAQQGFSHIRRQPGEQDNEQRILAVSRDGLPVQVLVAAHGSGTGFTALQAGSAELAASSRPIKDVEQQQLAHLGDLRSRAAEQIIALDGLAIVVHPDNPLPSLSTAALARLFAGEISDWSQLGAPAGPVRLYARDDKSGTFDTFKELVLASHGKQLAPGAERFESSERLSDAVSADRNGIGFIGLPYIRQARALPIADGDSQPMPPSQALIATEDYPLSRRLFLYAAPGEQNPWVQALFAYAHSNAGQAVVTRSGFIGQQVQAMQVEPQAQMPARYRQLAGEARRLSVNFRFHEGSAQLDNKAMRDIERLLDYLKRNDKMHNQAVLVGFGDARDDAERARLLSQLRAMTVRRELVRNGVLLREIAGLGDELPVATNSADDGRVKNRRVEVWVY